MYAGAFIILLFVLLMNLECIENNNNAITNINTNTNISSIRTNSKIINDQEVTTKRIIRNKSLLALIFSNKTRPNKIPTCSWLKAHKKQYAQCINKRGFAKVLQDARQLAVKHCQEQFSFDRWDCTKVESFMFKRIYRETAFMQAITASALMYTVGKACSDAKLEKCFCTQRPKKTNSKWHYVGCGDDTKMARKITRRFLRQGNDRKDRGLPSKDGINIKQLQLKQDIFKNNIDIGMQTVKEHKIDVCVCHGYSGSCTLKTCWSVIKPEFSEIADSIKLKYNSAKHFKHENGKTMSDKRDRGDLIYLAQSPTFCDATHGRLCKNHNHCATLCCGRGYDMTSVLVVNKKCNCRWNNESVNMSCDVCKTNESKCICK